MFTEAVFTEAPVRYSNAANEPAPEYRKYALPADGDEGVEWLVTHAVVLLPESAGNFELRRYSVCAKLDFLGVRLPSYEFCTSAEPIRLTIRMAGPSLN